MSESATIALVRSQRPKAKAVKAGVHIWAIVDGNEELSVTFQGRKAAWQKALSNLNKQHKEEPTK